jgi:hypothetical protein
MGPRSGRSTPRRNFPKPFLRFWLTPPMKLRLLIGLPLALLTLYSACSPKRVVVAAEESHAGPASPVDAGTAVDLDDPLSCVGCHPAIVAEWTESMHSQAHHDADPIYGAMRSLRMGKEGAAIGERCANCHNPRSPSSPDAPAGRAGVSCATCHNLAHVRSGAAGAAALEWRSDGLLRGSHDLDAGLTPAHPTGAKFEPLADGTTVCLACHAEEKNKAGVPTCSTGAELASAGETRSCSSCHMPEVAAPNGPQTSRTTHRSHVFSGPHRAWAQKDTSLLETAFKASGRFEKGAVVVTLENLSGHGFPTGFPARMAAVVLKGFDKKGAEIWRNVTKEPMKEHPEAVLNVVYAGADGGTVLAPYGVRIARDNRLKPKETRELKVLVPKAVVQVDVSVRVWLVAPMAAAALGVAERPEARPMELPRAAILRR